MDNFNKTQINFILLTAVFMFYLFNCLGWHQGALKKISRPYSLASLKKAPPYPGKTLSGTAAVSHRAASGAMRSILNEKVSRSALAAKGTLKLIAVRCEFALETGNPLITGDGKASLSAASVSANLDKLKNYYGKVSYGALNLSIDLAGQVFELPKKMSQYGSGGDAPAVVKSLVSDLVSVSSLDPAAGRSDTSKYIDYSSYDAVIAIHAGVGEESDVAGGGAGDTPDDIWSMAFDDLNITLANGGILNYAIVVPESEAQDNNFENGPAGVMCHEFGHLLGLPDLYDADNSSLGAGAWDLMGYGAWRDNGNSPCMLSSWSMIQLGYLTPVEVVSNAASLSVAALSDSPAALKVYASSKDKNKNEYFLIENRQKKGADSFIEGGGILIWHIDDAAGSVESNNINADETHKRVDLESAEGLDSSNKDRLDYNAAGTKPMSDKDPFYAGYKTVFDAWSNPSSLSYNMTDAPVAVEVLSPKSDIMSVKIGVDNKETPSGVQISKTYFYPNPVSDSSGKIYYFAAFKPDEVKIKIFDRNRRTVLSVDHFGRKGHNEFSWNLADDNFNEVPNGTYFYKITARSSAGEAEKTGKIAVLR